jgi:hypothetical protein
MTPAELEQIRERLGYVQAIRRFEAERRRTLLAIPGAPPAGSDFCRACGQDTQSAQDGAALLAEVDRLRAEVDRVSKTVGAVLEHSGCSCDCDHSYTEHDPECERCLACEIQEALTPAAAPTAPHQGDTE